MKPHRYDGTLNDGFCGECGLRRDEGLHTREPWEEAWERSLQIQRTVHEALRARETRLRPADQVSDTGASK